MLNWYTLDYSASRTAAHEFGHMLGEWDEYSGGAVDPVTELLSNGLMGSLYGETLSYYYDPFLEWYEDKLAAYEVDEPVPTPEPSTWAMLAAGLMAVVVMNRKQLV